MRTFSFFNEKGGVGKSLHTVMFASFLAYDCGAKVLVVDFENPSPRLDKTRADELKKLSDPSSVLSRYVNSHGGLQELYDICTPLKDQDFNYNKEQAEELRESIWTLISTSKYDYILFDFPGLLVENSPAYDCIVHGQVDLVAVPFDTEPMTRRASLMTCSVIQRSMTHVISFWNNVSAEEVKRKGFLEIGEKTFTKLGIEVSKYRIKSFVKARRDSSEHLFVRSTVCWPERYVELACPSLIDFYRELKERLDNTDVNRNSVEM